MEGHEKNSIHISRDKIRFSLVSEDEDYFSKEDKVFDTFVSEINDAIYDKDIENIFVDATHINEKSRNKLLTRLAVAYVDIIPVNFNVSLETCLAQNEKRRGTRAYVPKKVIKRMYYNYCAPTMNELFKYERIITINESD